VAVARPLEEPDHERRARKRDRTARLPAGGREPGRRAASARYGCESVGGQRESGRATPGRNRGTAKTGLVGGLQPRAGRPEHESHLPDDDPIPARDDRHRARRLRTWRHLLRRRRGVWPFRGRAHPRRGHRAVPGQGGDHLEVRLEHRPRDRRAAPWPQQSPRSHPAGRRGHAEAAAHRPHRSPLPAPGRPAGAHRGRRRRGRAPDEARQGPPLGALGDGSEDSATRPRRRTCRKTCRSSAS